MEKLCHRGERRPSSGAGGAGGAVAKGTLPRASLLPAGALAWAGGSAKPQPCLCGGTTLGVA